MVTPIARSCSRPPEPAAGKAGSGGRSGSELAVAYTPADRRAIGAAILHHPAVMDIVAANTDAA